MELTYLDEQKKNKIVNRTSISVNEKRAYIKFRKMQPVGVEVKF